MPCKKLLALIFSIASNTLSFPCSLILADKDLYLVQVVIILLTRLIPKLCKLFQASATSFTSSETLCV
uniref:Uncharacterized protein n=1 Tax=Myoviridae sp. cthAo37 TaxID=2827701 RepID=A0A8S5S4N1_9CAUD|nr:MAG TPA: hypothetical protein [Myoviridae sp. cthAo37]